jgi:hypothetical protein
VSQFESVRRDFDARGNEALLGIRDQYMMRMRGEGGELRLRAQLHLRYDGAGEARVTHMRIYQQLAGLGDRDASELSASMQAHILGRSWWELRGLSSLRIRLIADVTEHYPLEEQRGHAQGYRNLESVTLVRCGSVAYFAEIDWTPFGDFISSRDSLQPLLLSLLESGPIGQPLNATHPNPST